MNIPCPLEMNSEEIGSLVAGPSYRLCVFKSMKRSGVVRVDSAFLSFPCVYIFAVFEYGLIE